MEIKPKEKENKKSAWELDNCVCVSSDGLRQTEQQMGSKWEETRKRSPARANGDRSKARSVSGQASSSLVADLFLALMLASFPYS